MYVMATAGHVDHGKSTLLRALTGSDPDRLAEERRRGLTIDLGFVSAPTPGGEHVAFVDVPGHRRFLGTTLAGIATAPAVLFVVAADEGWMPQSQEHLAALDAFGVRDGLLAVTRSDLADPGPALADARARLARTALRDVGAVPVSARTGAGLETLRARLDALAARAAGAAHASGPEAPVRLWLDRSFSMPGAGTVVTGTLTAGTLAVGDELELSPAGQRVTVRGLHTLGRPVPRVAAPARVAVGLRRAHHTDVRRGHALVTPGAWWRTGVVDVRLPAAPAPPGDDSPRAGPPPRLPAEPLVHCGTAMTSARLRRFDDHTARLTLRTPLDLRLGDRLLLRDPGSRLLTGAMVLDVAPPELSGRGAGAARGRALSGLTGTPADGAALLRRLGHARPGDLASMGARVPECAVRAAGWVVDREHAAGRRERLREEVSGYGLPLGAARQLTGLPDTRLVEAVAGEEFTVRDGRLYRAGDAGRLPEEVREAAAALRQELSGAPFRAPGRGRLAELGVTRRQVAVLVGHGELEQYGEVLLPRGAAELAAGRLRALDGPFTVGECCRALDTSRRVAVPLLEALDRAGVTVRDADGRRVVRPGTEHHG